MIKFVDLNNNLVEKVRVLGIDAICADYFTIAYKTLRPVLMTASNPHWSMGGGIDYLFTEHFPKLCQYKKVVGGEMERRMNICFCITVNEHLKTDKETVKKAIQFAIDNTYEGETLLIHGAGTGIGGLKEDELVEILSELEK